jgi:hypothetical protein
MSLYDDNYDSDKENIDPLLKQNIIKKFPGRDWKEDDDEGAVKQPLSQMTVKKKHQFHKKSDDFSSTSNSTTTTTNHYQEDLISVKLRFNRNNLDKANTKGDGSNSMKMMKKRHLSNNKNSNKKNVDWSSSSGSKSGNDVVINPTVIMMNAACKKTMIELEQVDKALQPLMNSLSL